MKRVILGSVLIAVSVTAQAAKKQQQTVTPFSDVMVYQCGNNKECTASIQILLRLAYDQGIRDASCYWKMKCYPYLAGETQIANDLAQSIQHLPSTLQGR